MAKMLRLAAVLGAFLVIILGADATLWLPNPYVPSCSSTNTQTTLSVTLTRHTSLRTTESHFKIIILGPDNKVVCEPAKVYIKERSKRSTPVTVELPIKPVDCVDDKAKKCIPNTDWVVSELCDCDLKCGTQYTVQTVALYPFCKTSPPLSVTCGCKTASCPVVPPPGTCKYIPELQLVTTKFSHLSTTCFNSNNQACSVCMHNGGKDSNGNWLPQTNACICCVNHFYADEAKQQLCVNIMTNNRDRWGGNDSKKMAALAHLYKCLADNKDDIGRMQSCQNCGANKAQDGVDAVGQCCNCVTAGGQNCF